MSVLAPIDEYVRYTEEFPQVEHIGLQNLDRDGTNPIKDIRLIKELVTTYRRVDPDLIIHYTVKPNIYGGIASKIAGVKSVAVVTGLGYPFLHQGFTKVFVKHLYRVTNKWHSKVIFENKDDFQLFIEEDLVNADKGISIKGCGVDIEHFKPNGIHPVKHGVTTFTFIGRLLYDKGVGEFIEAAKLVLIEYPKTRFWLIGQIDEENPSAIRKSDLVEWLKQPGIYYLGSKNDVRPYIQESDCIVLPSYREAIARSITEAMAMAKPVIGTDTAGIREAIEDRKNGFLARIGSVDSLAEVMIEFVRMNKQNRDEMGKHGRRKVIEEFNEDKIAKEINDILRLL